MPNVNLKQLISDGKQVVASAGSQINQLGNAIGSGNVGISAGPNGVSISGNFNQKLQRKISGNSIKSPLASLYSPSSKTVAPLIFPQDLDDEHYMLFNVKERRRPSRKEQGEVRTFRTIVLPIPSNLQIQYDANYSNEELGLFGGMAAGMVGASDLKGAGRDISNLISSKIQGAADALKNNDLDAGVQGLGAAMPAIATGAAATVGGPLAGLLALGGTSGGVVSGIKVAEGLAVNPHMAVLFQGVGFRDHSFSYRFVARNQTESRLIQKIIGVFKYHMHPSFFAGNLGFKYPEEFEIEFATALAPNLYKIGTSVLKSFQVNYNGEGMPIFFEDTGAPVVVDITLGFQETKIVTKDDMDDPNQQSYNEQMMDIT